MEFMKICQIHRNLSEGAQKLSHVVSYRKDKGNISRYNSDTKPFVNNFSKSFSDQRRNHYHVSGSSGRNTPYEQEFEGYSEDDFIPVNMAETSTEEHARYEHGLSDPREVEASKHPDQDGDTGNKVGDSKFNLLMQGDSHMGPNHPPVPIDHGQISMRRPPPVPVHGVCFEVLKFGTCEAHKMGRCTYDHSVAALTAYNKRQLQNIEVFVAKVPSNGGDSKPRA